MSEHDERAFPVACAGGAFNKGMTLRDYFAASALTGLLASPVVSFSTRSSPTDMAYEYADFMLASREKKIGGAP